jgi:hypothetical protein
MSLIIKKDEAMRLLEQNRKHYLWNKPFSRWTEADVDNLRNGVNINYGNALRERKPKQSKPYEVKQMEVKRDNPGLRGTRTGRELLVITESGQQLQFKSVVKAADATGVPLSNIYALLNGRYAQSHGFTFKKL